MPVAYRAARPAKTDPVDAHRETLGRLLAAVRNIEADILAEIERAGPRRPEPPPAALPLKRAAARAGRSEECVRCWAIRYRIGHRVGGRWMIFVDRLDALLAGDTCRPAPSSRPRSTRS